MLIEPMGDAAFVLRDLPTRAHLLAGAIRSAGYPGVLDAAASYETVGVYCEPCSWTSDDLLQALRGLDVVGPVEQRLHEIPVCYALGEDLAAVAHSLSLPEEEVVRLHTSAVYECFAVGFCPGFPYLGWLPHALCGVARLDAPRLRVLAGSVGLTGNQTGVYPVEHPGGWNLIGRTPLVIADAADRYFPISAGDQIRFVAIAIEEFSRLEGTRL